MNNKERKIDYRWNLVCSAREVGISETARKFGTTRTTVYKWVSRYKKEGVEGLKNRSRLHQQFPNKMPDDIVAKIVETRRKNQTWGARRIIRELNLPYSHTAVHKKLRQAGLIKKEKETYY